MTATLDEVFNSVADIEEKTQNRVSILLSETPDRKDLYEVVDIKGIDGMNPSFPVFGLKDSKIVMVSSWIRKTEFKKIRTKNRDVKFIIRVRGGLNGKRKK